MTCNLFTSLHSCLYVYLKLRCLGFLCALSASSVYPKVWRVSWGTRWYWWWGVLGSSLTLKATDTGKWVKQRLVISVSTLDCLLPWVTVWPKPSPRSAQYSHHRDLFPASGNWSFLCLFVAVRRAEVTLMMTSHPCEVFRVCVRPLLLSVV